MSYNYYINQTTLKILGLFRNDYKTSFYLREIARNVHVDAKAVGLQLNKLEKANIVKSLQKGKNKEHTLNLNNFLTLYYLILAETFTTLEYLNRNFEIKKLVGETTEKMGKTAILFGSFAKENMTKESDIDILIIDNEKSDLTILKELGNLLSREVNVKLMSEEQFTNGLVIKDPLVQEIAANHIILKGIDNYCNMLWRYYAK
jgi:predicted nucleotidyltransferase